ncbi:MAG: hypothetical protein J0J01_04365 [Reyranella sp.]|uniref:hypothetical protein n=1 Tax=Reyranella sp. TaxID=1929291 RepID=UPI001AC24418|nr:hypothetical protein [Reyranella sp.]MBN9086123.1 hypothetical protein [Reyranella sp.]
MASRTPFAAGEGFALDQSYRLAHLPLVAPHHPRVIASAPGKDYAMGRHGKAVSLALPVPDVDHLLEPELRTMPFAHKIAWDIVTRRRGKLHATLCGAPVTLDGAQRYALAGIGPITVELRGLFSGTVNHGRLYLRVYPEKRDGENLLARIQRLLARRETGLYLVGLHNLTDDLDFREAAALAALIERWWDRPILRWQVEALWLLEAWDDLVLDGGVGETVPLRALDVGNRPYPNP